MAQSNGLAKDSFSDGTKLSIPLIDLTPLTSNELSTRMTCATAIFSAFSKYGFCYLTSPPGIPSDTIHSIFAHSASFFTRPQHEKDSLTWTTPEANRGYISMGREKTSHSLNADEVAAERKAAGADLKESIEIGRDDVPAHPNRWPDTLDADGTVFRAAMIDFYARCKDLHQLIMSAVALALGLHEDYFDSMVRKGDNNLRLLHYPAVSAATFRSNAGQVRAGAHTDYGSITLLWQDARGGLQVQPDGEGGEWKDVTPIPGTLVVNAGDLLARWSNERIRSTRHRVVEPPLPSLDKTSLEKTSLEKTSLEKTSLEKTSPDEMNRGNTPPMHPARYSVVYFCNPDMDTLIDALPNTYGAGLGDKKYPPVRTEDYLVARLAATV